MSSQPLALSADGTVLVVANTGSDSVSFFDLRRDVNRKVATVPVQSEPRSVALSPNGLRAYVANTESGTVSFIRLDIGSGSVRKPHKHLKVGGEPTSLVPTPNGTRLYVGNGRANTVSVIDTQSETIIATIPVGLEPRGLAITNDGDEDDADEKLYVSSFLSLGMQGKHDEATAARRGLVTIISTGTNAVVGASFGEPSAGVGFDEKAERDSDDGSSGKTTVKKKGTAHWGRPLS